MTTHGPEGFGWRTDPDDPDTLRVALPHHPAFEAFAQEHGAVGDGTRWKFPASHLTALEDWVQQTWGVHPRDVIVHDDGAQGPPAPIDLGALVWVFRGGHPGRVVAVGDAYQGYNGMWTQRLYVVRDEEPPDALALMESMARGRP